MFYLFIAFAFLWLINFIYLFCLDRQIKDVSKRLKARAEAQTE
jgi:CcmD family protein